MRLARRPAVWLAAALAAAVVALVVIRGDGDDGGEQQAPKRPVASKPGPPERGHAAHHRRRHGAVHRAVSATRRARLDPDQRPVARVIEAYVTALNARDGEQVCALFVPDALANVELPRDRGDCAASLSASIGYRDPRGTPVYDRSRVARIGSVTIDGSEARVTATVVTRFADRREPSVEDDLVYLRQQGGRWLIVKPSATLYRAIGAADIPPRVLAPP